MKKLNISKLKKLVWKEFSLYIRKKYADYRGYVTCYTCPTTKHYKDGMQAGHAFSGRHNSILFEEDIVRVQCIGCNCFNSGKLDVFTHRLREELGNKKFEELYKLKSQTRTFNIEELKTMQEFYKAKARE